MSKYNVVVIGTGNAGLGAALALADQGLKPLVIEQHNLPGGCATSFVRGRFEFDASLHALWYDVPVFRNVWEDRFGITENMKPLEESFLNIYRNDEGEIIRELYPTGVEKFIGAVCEKMPDSAEAVQKFFGLCVEAASAPMYERRYTIMGNSRELYREVPMEMSDEEFDEKFPNYRRINKMTVQQVYDEIGASKELQQLLSFIWWYIGPNVENIPFPGYAEVVLAFLGMNAYFPEHTCHGYTSEFEKLIREKGGDVWYNTEVVEILTDGEKVTGVKTNHGDIIETDYIVSNTGPKTVYGKLIKSEEEEITKRFDEHKEIEDAFSFVQIYLGLDKTAEELGITQHHIFANECMDPNKAHDAAKTMSGDYLIGVLCPNITIDGYTPEGTCSLTLSVPMFGSVLEGMSQKDYFKFKEDFTKEIIRKTSVLLDVDLEECIEEVVIATPEAWGRYAKLPGGALGYDVGINNMKKQFAIKEKNLQGLHFVGQFESGIGYPNNATGIMIGDKVAGIMKGVM